MHKVVIAVDTIERVLYQEFFNVETSHQSWQIALAWQWLFDHLVAWPNVVILAAGRPQSQFLIEHAKKSANVTLIARSMNSFSEQETYDYLTAATNEARRNQELGIVRQIETLSFARRQELYENSKGLPIRLALSLDLIMVTGEWPLPIQEEDLIQRLVEQGGRLGETVVALGRASKGVTAPLLAEMLDITELEAAERLKEVRYLSFVKVRVDGRFFLHDEIYALLRRGIYKTHYDAAAAERVYQALYRYYGNLVRENRHQLKQLFADVETGRSATLNIQQLNKFDMEYRALLTELLYYRLHQRPVRGFLRYYRYTRDAAYSRDTLLDQLLSLTLQDFWREVDPENKKTEIRGLSRDLVTGVSLIRGVVRAWAEARYQQAVNDATHIRQTYLTKLPDDRALGTRTALDVWEAYALIYIGGAEGQQRAEQLLNHAIDSMHAYLAQPFFNSITIAEGEEEATADTVEYVRKWRAQAVFALAYRIRGYYYRTLNQLSKAATDYRHATNRFRQLNIQVELAMVENDLGYVYMLQNQTDNAFDMVRSGLKIRRELGNRVNVGLSLNTLATIWLAEGGYTEAMRYAQQALALFRAIGHRRGIGLALITSAEIARRSVTSIQIEDYRLSEEKSSILHQADQYAQEAITIFQEIKEAIRQVQVHIEAGCIRRAQLELAFERKEANDRLAIIRKESESNLRTAIEIARKSKLIYEELDATVNLVSLGAIAQDEELYQQAVTEAQAIIPPAYQIDSHTGRPALLLEQATNNLWLRIAKLETLRGHYVMDAYLKTGTSHRERSEHEELLQQAAAHYTLAMQYDSFYGADFRDLRRMTTQIHNKLGYLHTRELRIFCRQVSKTEGEYSLGKSKLQQLLEDRTLWQE